MAPNLLILGGTAEAATLAQQVANAGFRATVSLAGRVARPKTLPLPVRIGGFGGVAGLTRYLTEEGISHVVDATHPFAARISANAAAACSEIGAPLIRLTRPAWVPETGDRWIRVADISGAGKALEGHRRRVFLAVGRMNLAAFASQPQHFYLLRLVDPPDEPVPLPDHQVIIDRGPFDAMADRGLMERHGIGVVVSKNSGGTGAVSKITAARALGLPVIMIDRPAMPLGRVAESPEEVLRWIAHAGTDLGV